MENERIKLRLIEDNWIGYGHIDFYYTPLEVLASLLEDNIDIHDCLVFIEWINEVEVNKATFTTELYALTYYDGYIIVGPEYSLLEKGIYSSPGIIDKDAMDPKLILPKQEMLNVYEQWYSLMTMKPKPVEIDFILTDNKVSFTCSMYKNPNLIRGGGREVVPFKRSKTSNVYHIVGLYNTILRTLACFLVNDYSLNAAEYIQWVENVKEQEAVLKGSYSLIYVDNHIVVSHVPHLLEKGIYTPSNNKIKQISRHANCPKFITPRERMIKILKDWQAIIATKPEEILLTYECDYIDENDNSNDAFEYDIYFTSND